jgi:hypothetical protein
MIRYAKRTVLEVETGIFLTGIIGLLILGFTTGFTSPKTLGFAAGIVVSAVFFYSMGVSLETAIDMGEETAAKRHSLKMYAIRVAALVLIGYVILKSSYFDVITAALALFSIKIGAYLQPVVHRLFVRWFHLSEPVYDENEMIGESDDDDPDDDDLDESDPEVRFEKWLEKKNKK